MRAMFLVVLLAFACGRRGSEGTPAAPDVTAARPPAPSPPTPPPPATTPPDPVPTASNDWTLEDVGATEVCATSVSCPLPTLAVDGGGAPLFGVHRYDVRACLWCSADRIVRRWSGSAWESLMSAGGWPGGASLVSFARDPASGTTLFADTDLSDVRRPPIRLHVWTLDPAGGASELRPALGEVGWAGNPVVAVDGAGTVTVTWLEEDASGDSVVRSARSAGATWDLLPDFVVSPARGTWMVLDATGAPVVAACGNTSVQVARWDAAARAWQALPPPPGSSSGCPVRALRDGNGLLLASGWQSVSVDRWDGTSWTPVGRGLGEYLLDLAWSPRGTPLLITTLGILERTDAWHVVAAPGTAPPDDFTPAAMVSGAGELWTWWVRESNASHLSGGQLRRMTLRQP